MLYENSVQLQGTIEMVCWYIMGVYYIGIVYTLYGYSMGVIVVYYTGIYRVLYWYIIGIILVYYSGMVCVCSGSLLSLYSITWWDT